MYKKNSENVFKWETICFSVFRKKTPKGNYCSYLYFKLAMCLVSNNYSVLPFANARDNF